MFGEYISLVVASLSVLGFAVYSLYDKINLLTSETSRKKEKVVTSARLKYELKV